MKADKKVAEKEAKIKEQLDQKKESNDQGAQNACALDEETLDPNVRFLLTINLNFTCLLLNVSIFLYNIIFSPLP